MFIARITNQKNIKNSKIKKLFRKRSVLACPLCWKFKFCSACFPSSPQKKLPPITVLARKLPLVETLTGATRGLLSSWKNRKVFEFSTAKWQEVEIAKYTLAYATVKRSIPLSPSNSASALDFMSHLTHRLFGFPRWSIFIAMPENRWNCRIRYLLKKCFIYSTVYMQRSQNSRMGDGNKKEKEEETWQV